VFERLLPRAALAEYPPRLQPLDRRDQAAVNLQCLAQQQFLVAACVVN
jgi:hypothetical protein